MAFTIQSRIKKTISSFNIIENCKIAGVDEIVKLRIYCCILDSLKEADGNAIARARERIKVKLGRRYFSEPFLFRREMAKRELVAIEGGGTFKSTSDRCNSDRREHWKMEFLRVRSELQSSDLFFALGDGSGSSRQSIATTQKKNEDWKLRVLNLVM